MTNVQHKNGAPSRGPQNSQLLCKTSMALTMNEDKWNGLLCQKQYHM